MARQDNNELGSRGECIFGTIITRLFGMPKPAFRITFLGEKWPHTDFLVELTGSHPVRPYFFVQVKATSRGFTSTRRLNVQLTAKTLKEMIKFPAPTYFVGIDEKKENGYILAVRQGGTKSFGSMPMKHPLSKKNLQLLKNEVLDYWTSNGVCKFVSCFDV